MARETQMQIRLSKKEKADIRRLAKDAGKTPSEFLRDQALALVDKAETLADEADEAAGIGS